MCTSDIFFVMANWIVVPVGSGMLALSVDGPFPLPFCTCKIFRQIQNVMQMLHA